MRSTRPLTILAAALAASLLPTPQLAAQQSPARPTPPAVVRPNAAVVRPNADAEQVGTDDEGNLRRLVDEEAVHRDRAARISRLRTLAEQSGQRERLAEIEKLDRVESARYAAAAQQMRRRMSAAGQQRADEAIRKGGVVRIRRGSQTDQPAVRPASRRAAGAESTPVRRPAATTPKRSTATPRAAPTRTGSSSSSSSSSSSRSGTGSSGRSPR